MKLCLKWKRYLGLSFLFFLCFTGCERDEESELVQINPLELQSVNLNGYANYDFNHKVSELTEGFQVIRTNNENFSTLTIQSDCADQSFDLLIPTDHEIELSFTEAELQWYCNEQRGDDYQFDDLILLCNMIAQSEEKTYLLGTIYLNMANYNNELYTSNRLFVPDRTYQKQVELEYEYMGGTVEYDETFLLSLQYADRENFYFGYQKEEEFIEERNIYAYVDQDDGRLYELSDDCKIYYLTRTRDPLTKENAMFPFVYVQISELELRSRLHHYEVSSLYFCGIKDGKILFMANIYMP